MMLVTSKGTMDKSTDDARRYLSKKADFLGAIRLPQTAFKKNAGTDVVTDVIFLQKREDGVAQGGQAWNELAEIKAKDKDGQQQTFAINKYFVDNPGMVLGTHAAEGSMYRANEYTVKPKRGDIGEQFAEAIKNLPKDIYQAPGSAPTVAEVAEFDFSPTSVKESAFYKDGKMVIVPVHLGGENQDRGKVNAIKSIYGKDRLERWIDSQVKAGRLLYVNTKKAESSDLTKQLHLPTRKSPEGPAPARGQNDSAIDIKILTEDDLVNTGFDKQLTLLLGLCLLARQSIRGNRPLLLTRPDQFAYTTRD